MFGSVFKPRAHYVYNYKPRYYNERKERLELLKKKYEKNDDSQEDISRLNLTKDNLKSDWHRQKKTISDKGTNRRLAIIIAILVGILAYLFELHKLF